MSVDQDQMQSNQSLQCLQFSKHLLYSFLYSKKFPKILWAGLFQRVQAVMLTETIFKDEKAAN